MSRYDTSRQDALATRLPLDLTADLEAELRSAEEEEQGSASALVRDPASVTSSALQAAFGNDLVSSALNGGDSAGLSSLIAGDLALGAAGVASSGALDSNSAMQSALRDAGPLDHDPSHPSLRQLRTAGGEALPAAVRARMEAAFGHDFSHVRIHTDSTSAAQSQALNAHAFTIENHMWFGSGEYAPGTPQGDRLLAHELTHVVQADEGRIGSTGGGGLDVSSPTDGLEQEAYHNEDQILGALPSVAAAMAMDAAPAQAPSQAVDLNQGADLSGGDASGLALREAKGGTSASATPASKDAKEKPEKVQLTLGSQIIEFSLVNAGKDLKQAFPVDVEIAPGVRVTEASLVFDKSWGVKSGQLKGELSIGSSGKKQPATLTVGRNGKIEAKVKGIPLPLGDIAKGKMDVTLSNTGFSGKATVKAKEINLGPDLQLTDGEMVLKFDSNGQHTAEGEVGGKLGGVVKFKLKPGFDGERLMGDISTQLHEPVSLGNNVQIVSGSLMGKLPLDGEGTISGTLGVKVGELATGDVAASYSLSLNKGSAAPADNAADAPALQAPGAAEEAAAAAAPQGAGTPSQGAEAAPQSGPQSAERSPEAAPAPAASGGQDAAGAAAGGPPALDLGAEGAGVDGGQQAGGDKETPAAAGGEPAPAVGKSFTLQMPGTGMWSLKGTLQQSKDVKLVDGVTASGSTFEFDVQKNVLQPLVAHSTLKLPAGWDVALDGFYDPQASSFSGQGSAKLTAPLPVSDTGLAITAVEGNAYVDANKVTHLNGEVTAMLDRPGMPKLQVVVSDVNYDVETGDFSGAGKVAVTERLSLGKQGAYEVFLGTATDATALVEGGALTNVTGALELVLVEGKNDFIIATLNTAYDVTKGKLTGLAHGKIITEHKIGESAPNSFWLTATGEIAIDVFENAVNSVSGTVAVSVRDADGDWAKAEIAGTYTFVDDAGYTGEASLRMLRDHVVANVGEYRLALAASDKGVTAVLDQGKVNTVTGNIPFAILDSGEGPLFTGAIDGTYALGDKTFGGTGELRLARAVDFPMGDQALRVLPGTGGVATITANNVEKLVGDVKADVVEGGEPQFHFEGTGTYDVTKKNLTQATGTATMVAPERQISAVGEDTIWLIKGSTLTGDVADSKLSTLNGTILMSVRDATSEWAKVGVKGDYDFAGGTGFTGEGSFKVTRQRDIGAVGAYRLALDPSETGVTADVQQSQVKTITGAVPIAVLDGGEGALFNGNIQGTYAVAEKSFGGTGELHLARDIDFEVSGGQALRILTGTGGTATISASNVDKLDGGAEAELLKDGTPEFHFKGTGSYDVATKTITEAAGSVKLMVPERKVAESGDSSIWLSSGSELNANIKANKLTDINGDILLSVRDAEGEWCQATLKGKYDLAEGAGFTGQAGLALKRQYDIGKVGEYRLVLPAEGVAATADFENSAIKAITGKVPVNVLDGADAALLTGNVQGTYTVGDKSFTGSGELKLAHDVDYDVGAGYTLRVLQGSGGAGTITSKGIESLTGSVQGTLLKGGEPEVSFVGTGTFDVAKKAVTEASGTLTLLRTLEPMGEGNVLVTAMTGQGSLKGNALEKLTGEAKIRIPKLNNSTGTMSLTWSKKDGVDTIAGAGDVHVILLKDSGAGRSAKGDVKFNFDGGKKFTAAGDINYQLTKQIGGKVGVSLDEKLDPKVSGQLDLNNELIPAGDLFRQQLPLLPEMNIPIQAGPVPMVLKFGASAAFGLGMQALTLSSKIGISDWYPLRDESSVPNFDASAKLNWGLNLDAMAAAWLSLGVGVSALSVGGGLKGEAKLDVPLTSAVNVDLHGSADEFWGDLGVSMKLSADLSFAAKPYLYANLFSKKWEHDFEGWNCKLDDVFAFEWGKTYEFGDRKGQRGGSAAELSGGAAQQRDTLHDKAPATSQKQAKRPKKSEGGPDIGGAADLLKTNKGGGSDMEKRLGLIKDIAAGIGAVGYLSGLFGDLLAAVAISGPIGIPIMLVYKLIKGEFTWGKLVDAVKGAIKGAQAVYTLIQPYLPGWWETIKKIVSDGINLLDEWWNGDTRMHLAVQRGEHRYANAEMLGLMADRMLDTWSDEAHKRSVLTILETASQKGAAGTVVAKCGMDTLKSKMTGTWTASDIEERWKRWCVANGYARYERKEGWLGGVTNEFAYTR